jgi:thymidylate synthase (FAD)
MEVKYIQHCGTDLSVVNAARVSFNKESEWETLHPALCTKVINYLPTDPCRIDGSVDRLKGKDQKLIKYLASHGHTSPFNHTWVTLHVKAPIFVARQLVKHKFMPWNEVSRRYVDEKPEFYIPDVWRKKADNKKQGSSDEGINPEYNPLWNQNKVLSSYLESIQDYDLCPEQARMVLPLNTYTEWYWSGTLGAWSDMYNLRVKPDTQLETQEVARMCGEIIEPLFPVSWKELTND